MKEHDLGKDYLVPGPVYRAVPSRDTTLPGTEVTPYQLELAKIQDALETAARAEGGLSLDGGAPYMKELEEEAVRSKYQRSVGVLKPIRSTSKYEHPVDNAGLFSFMTFNWLTPLAVHAHRKGQLLLEDVWSVSQFESCEVNHRRLAGLWEEERRVKGDEASLCGVVWTFCRTRLLLSILCLMVTQLAGFSGPVSNAISPSPGEALSFSSSLLLSLTLALSNVISRVCQSPASVPFPPSRLRPTGECYMC